MRSYPSYLGTPMKTFGDGRSALGRYDGPIAADLAQVSVAAEVAETTTVPAAALGAAEVAVANTTSVAEA